MARIEDHAVKNVHTPIIESLKDYGLDPAPLVESLASGELSQQLQTLSSLVERRYQGRAGYPTPDVVAAMKPVLDATIRQVVRDGFSGFGIEVSHSAPIHAGGFSWVVEVTKGGHGYALIVPKFTSGDYREKVAIRARIGELFPPSKSCRMPTAAQVFELPVPAALMTLAKGENCYPLTFDGEGKPHAAEAGRESGVQVFRTLGEFARAFSSVSGERFGAPLAPQHSSAADYILPLTDEIERITLSNSSLALEKYGLSLAQLRRIVDWVKNDCLSQSRSYLYHGDLSPWNLLRDEQSGIWTIVDGDDARFGVLGEQIGVCLNSMRGNFNRDWIEALLDGYGETDLARRRETLLRGAAYGTVTYGLINAGRPWDVANADMCRNAAFSFLAPCVRLFDDLV